MARRAGSGIHTLIGQPDQLRTMGLRCECVLEHLDQLLEHTRGPTPPRDRDFRLMRTFPGTLPRAEEAMWERAMWRRWGPLGDRTTPFLPICPHLQTYQYPLKRVRTDADWGKIDLLGVSPDHLPVVVELKRAESPDTVLRMLLEMVAYGLALRQVWSRLRVPHWEAAMRESWQHATPTPTELGRVTLIGAGPPRYWVRACATNGKDRARRVPDDAWSPFAKLVAEVSRRCDFSIHFACIYETRVGDGDAHRLRDGRLRDRRLPVPFAGHPTPVRAELLSIGARA